MAGFFLLHDAKWKTSYQVMIPLEMYKALLPLHVFVKTWPCHLSGFLFVCLIAMQRISPWFYLFFFPKEKTHNYHSTVIEEVWRAILPRSVLAQGFFFATHEWVFPYWPFSLKEVSSTGSFFTCKVSSSTLVETE